METRLLHIFVTSPQPRTATRGSFTPFLMDGECAFCGRSCAATYELFCHDCQTQHCVCHQCADETRTEAAQLGLDILPEAA
jgi:hypothetical protein